MNEIEELFNHKVNEELEEILDTYPILREILENVTVMSMDYEDCVRILTKKRIEFVNEIKKDRKPESVIIYASLRKEDKISILEEQVFLVRKAYGDIDIVISNKIATSERSVLYVLIS